MITNQKYVPDIRVRREAEGLVDAGHRVHVVCRRQYDTESTDELNGVQITRVCSDSKIVHNLAERIYSATWYQPVWALHIRKVLHEGNFDMIYYHDIEHAKLATRIADWYDLTIVADLHEMYPQAASLWRKSSSLSERLDPKMLFTPEWRLQNLEEFAINHADGLITISEELLEYFEQKYNYSQLSGVVRNVPDLERLDQMEIENLGYGDELVISYIGGFTPQRGIKLAIEAMPDVLESVPDAKLVLVGDGDEKYVSSLKTLAEDLGVSSKVEFTGWVDFERIGSYYNTSDVTLIPYHQTQASKYALPNKLFQAMAFRTPVVVNDLPTLKRLVDKHDVGEVFSQERPLSVVLIDLLQNKNELEQMGCKGRDLVEERYNVKLEIEYLNQLVESLSTDNSEEYK